MHTEEGSPVVPTDRPFLESSGVQAVGVSTASHSYRLIDERQRSRIGLSCGSVRRTHATFGSDAACSERRSATLK
jgi:hypothetical protein